MADVKEITVPDIGDFDAVDVIEVLVSVGDTVEAEDSLITLESDKATMEVPAPFAGKITEVMIKPGDKVAEGTAVAKAEVAEDGAAGSDDSAAPAADSEEPAGETAPAAEEPAPSASPAPAEAPKAAPAPEPAAPAATEQPVHAETQRLAHAGPSVRRFARELGVPLDQVTGSGHKGRITHEDVQAFVKSVMEGGAAAAPAAGAPAGGSGIPPIPEVDFSRFGEVEEVDLPRIKRLSGPHLHRSWLNIPHVTQFDEADITELEAFRKAEKAAAEKAGVKLTPLAFLVKASARALTEFPDFNSSLRSDGAALIRKHYVNIGVAVDTPQGLVVPVIKDADQKGVHAIAADLGDLSVKARDGKLGPGDMQGGTFSVSSLGGIGGTAFTPIVNAPEVAILGVSKSAMKPVWNGSEFAPRLMLPLSLSYDHRVIDGASAARFTAYLAGVLGDLRRLIL
ncbi:pyruvate dehydrogenase complex dihydrolipoamide acetyltransferase [Spiribacter salinus M19-40]|uniref:Acetyltransferase component of pyruvate dehydrogenase complex n=1 Tax=Spiribacter salinus M19-40 TaxID=1260251 RepID=R4VKG6_9GAMM|nr:dihydrolipoyllysine-residue acetyltransferase [Spiribacter salinus]AGM40143.1 pyruvate dehydrogenase complex dihydrolipoamide acetyltransferase [Spiribacter salinus M19-40]MBY5268626.1 dihydrolipoyllysine-residue acetyltransferase [Spiribacter salinus]